MGALGTEGRYTNTAITSPTPRDLEWAAGFLEGEGSFRWNKSPGGGTAQVSVSHVDWAPVQRLVELFGGTVITRPPGRRGWSPQLQWRIHGARARGVMMTLYGLLSKRRQAQIRKAIL